MAKKSQRRVRAAISAQSAVAREYSRNRQNQKMNLECTECVRLWAEYGVALREAKGGEKALLLKILGHEVKYHPEKQWNQSAVRDVLDK
jgi:hypothetical protein